MKLVSKLLVIIALMMPVMHSVAMHPAGSEHRANEQMVREWQELIKKVDYNEKIDFARVENLLAAGVDINTLYEDNTLLGAAIFAKYKPLAKLLIDKGASVQLTPAQRQLSSPPSGPLTRAVGRNDVQLVELLLKAGAPAQKDGTLEAPLNVALSNNSKEIVKLLLAYNADVNSQEYNGDTPLHYAVRYAPTLIPLLLEAGADMTIKNNAGQTPADLARAGTDENAQNALQFLTTQKLK